MRYLAVMLLLCFPSLTCKNAPERPSITKKTSGNVNPARPDPVAPSPPVEGSGPVVAPEPGTTTPEPVEPPKPDPIIPSPPDPLDPPKEALKLENGFYTIQNAASKKCLEITSADKSTSIVQFGCNGSRIQAFKIESVGKQEFKIVNIDTKKAFDIKDNSKADGAVLEQYDFANGDNQTFIIDYDAASETLVNIRPKHSMKYLEIPSSSNKSKMQPKQQSENKKTNQRWKLTKISEPNNAAGVRYYFVNECDHDVFVGTQPNPGFPIPPNDGFKLSPGASNKIDTAAKWDGRFWGRYNCSMVNGKLQCESGNCAKGEKCGDTYGEPPVSLAEFKTNGFSNLDFYDISLVDGSNLPMDIRPMPLTLKADGAKGSCKHLECKPDLRIDCPAELQKKNSAGKVIGCMSACEKFRTDEYCCVGRFAAPNCQASHYAKWFDNKCPDAYSFAEDVKTFTCRFADYEIIFCPK